MYRNDGGGEKKNIKEDYKPTAGSPTVTVFQLRINSLYFLKYNIEDKIHYQIYIYLLDYIMFQYVMSD